MLFSSRVRVRIRIGLVTVLLSLLLRVPIRIVTWIGRCTFFSGKKRLPLSRQRRPAGTVETINCHGMARLSGLEWLWFIPRW